MRVAIMERTVRYAALCWFLRPSHPFVSMLAMLIVASGCSLPGVSGSATDDVIHGTSSPTVPATSDLHDRLEPAEPWIAYIRERGNEDSVLGSAVVIDEAGLLVTEFRLLKDSVEVVFADGAVAQPITIAAEENSGIALIKVGTEQNQVAVFSTARLGVHDPVFASGFDSVPGSAGRVSGQITGIEHQEDDDWPRVRGPAFFDTDLPLVSGLVGGALTSHDGSFVGILIPGPGTDDQRTFRAVSTWYLQAWLDKREGRLQGLVDEAGGWDPIEMPGGWSIRYPQGWQETNINRAGDRYRADILPADPDVPLQFEISVEPNLVGTDPDKFVTAMFADRPNATLWGIENVDGNPLVRLAVTQEGAVVELAYLLDPDYQIAISMTTGFAPSTDSQRAELSRDYFEAVLQTISR